ncbi:ATP-binding protein [Nocardioides sp.]|uniref:ATP-binding protein n=1 Tax=Nocardioides sp. TaxID=35761 RepID=UPI002717B4E7|nr:ATP-binding protein [Nocardioides sp.]MDO9454964.1 ATP-binding protein [Nocardioides sp.]
MIRDLVGGCISVDLRAMDTYVTVEVSGSHAIDLATAIRRAWSRCLTDGSIAADATVAVVQDDNPVVIEQARAQGALASTVRAELLDRLSPRVTVAAIDHQAGKMIMLHACGLADSVTGRTVALVAPSGTGKTTTSRTLGRHLGYVTDETVAIRADATISPYPKPLSVIGGPGGFKTQMNLDELDLLPAPARCELAGVALLVRDGSKVARAESIATVDALALLAPESSYLASVPNPLHRVAELLELTGGLRALHYSESEQLKVLVADMLQS